METWLIVLIILIVVSLVTWAHISIFKKIIPAVVEINKDALRPINTIVGDPKNVAALAAFV